MLTKLIEQVNIYNNFYIDVFQNGEIYFTALS